MYNDGHDDMKTLEGTHFQLSTLDNVFLSTEIRSRLYYNLFLALLFCAFQK